MMEIILFYIAAAIAVASTIVALTRSNAAHALIYLVMSILSMALIFFLIGAPMAAVLEIVVYAGAIMVLFLFVIMMIQLSEDARQQVRVTIRPTVWVVPALFAVILLGELVLAIDAAEINFTAQMVGPKEVALSLFGPYVLAVEIAAMLLLAGLVGAYHIGRHYRLKDAPPKVETVEAC